MRAEAIDKIQSLVQEADCKVVEVNGRKYTERALNPVRHILADVKALALTSLQGFIDYLNTNPDKFLTKIPADGNPTTPPCVIHVVSPTKVVLRSTVQDDDVNTRHAFAFAECVAPSAAFRFGQHIDRETFHVALLTLFGATIARGNILKLISSMEDASVIKTEDSGFSQTVTARVGVGPTVAPITVENPVMLAPLRSFPEITPVESPFLLRFGGGQATGRPVTCQLSECDGGLWAIETVKRIADHISSNIDSDLNVVILR